VSVVQRCLQETADNKQHHAVSLQVCRRCYCQFEIRIITSLFVCATGLSLTSLLLLYPSVLIFHCMDWRPSGVACGSFLGMPRKREEVPKRGTHRALDHRQLVW